MDQVYDGTDTNRFVLLSNDRPVQRTFSKQMTFCREDVVLYRPVYVTVGRPEKRDSKTPAPT